MATAKKPPPGITKVAPTTRSGKPAPAPAPKPAPTPSKAAVPAVRQGGQLSTADFNAKMAALVQQTKRTEAPAGGFISLKGTGMSIGGTPIVGNKFRAVIAEYRLDNQWYDKPYNPNSQEVNLPACWASARQGFPLTPWRAPRDSDDGDLIVSDDGQMVTEADNPQVEPGTMCNDCPKMAWGSAPPRNGVQTKAKACRESRRIQFIMLDQTHTPADVASASIYTMIPPPTSLDNFKGLMNDISDNLGVPYFAAIVEVEKVQHERYQFIMQYTVVDVLKDETVLYALMQRHEALAAKEVSMPKPDEAAAPPAAPDKRGRKF
jgi:hypothetical protein